MNFSISVDTPQEQKDILSSYIYSILIGRRFDTARNDENLFFDLLRRYSRKRKSVVDQEQGMKNGCSSDFEKMAKLTSSTIILKLKVFISHLSSCVRKVCYYGYCRQGARR